MAASFLNDELLGDIDTRGAVFETFAAHGVIGHDDTNGPDDRNDEHGHGRGTHEHDNANDDGEHRCNGRHEVDKRIENTARTMAYQDKRAVGHDMAAIVFEECFAIVHRRFVNREVFRGETQERGRELVWWDDLLCRRDRW